MKKALLFIFIICGAARISFCQEIIQGDRLLELVGKHKSSPLLQQFRQQEDFFNEYWNRSFTVYMDYNFSGGDTIREIQFENNAKRFQSEERYGRWNKQLPLQFGWTMMRKNFESIMGTPVKSWYSGSTCDYEYRGWQVRIGYENDYAAMISFKKDPGYAPPVKTAAETNRLIKLDVVNALAELNWPVLKQLVLSETNFKPFAGKDSTDYIGQVYYSTPHNAEGFERTAVKRIKSGGNWYYEAFYKTSADSNTVRKIFFALYNELKTVIKNNSGDDFILASSAKKFISESPMNWLVQWTLMTSHKILPPVNGKAKIALLLTGMKNTFKNDQMEYTIKLYVVNGNVEYDFFTWDKPR